VTGAHGDTGPAVTAARATAHHSPITTISTQSFVIDTIFLNNSYRQETTIAPEQNKRIVVVFSRRSIAKVKDRWEAISQA